MTIKWLVQNNSEIGVNAHENLNIVKQMVNLSRLELGAGGNGIKSLDQPKHLFDKLTKLSALILAGNELKRIPKDCFSENQYLHLLDLSGSELTTVDSHMLQFLNELHNIYLQSKLIHKIPIGITRRVEFLSNRSLVMFDISGSPLACTCNTGYLQE